MSIMSYMFYHATSFNQRQVNDMRDMLKDADSFNQSVNGWIVSVRDMPPLTNESIRQAASLWC